MMKSTTPPPKSHVPPKHRKNEKGLSLIESSMVLALAATVTAGVMFYYQAASDSNKTQSAISQVMSATAAINGLFVGQSSYADLSNEVLLNSSSMPDNYKDMVNKKLTNSFGGELSVSGTNGGMQYTLTQSKLPKSACISLATLNLGTSAHAYRINNEAPSGATPLISPALAANTCKDGSDNSVTYVMK